MEQIIDPNSFDKELEDGANPNPQPATEIEGTEQKETVTTEHQETDVDYRKKFVESSKEAHRLFEENKRKDQLIAQLQNPTDTPSRPDTTTEELYPGFNELDEEAQRNLVAYTDMVTKRVTEGIYNDPSISFARQSYNEGKFNSALDSVIAEYPDLAPSKEDFKSQYYNPQNVPDNIADILRQMAKVYLFDKAKDMGIEEAKALAERIELEDTTGGDRQPTARRTLADWQKLQQTNPAKFASLAKEYQSDLEAGLLNE